MIHHYLVHKVLENQNQLIDIENEFHMRDMDDIEDYLFE